jgi:hypothetical protein
MVDDVHADCSQAMMMADRKQRPLLASAADLYITIKERMQRATNELTAVAGLVRRICRAASFDSVWRMEQ